MSLCSVDFFDKNMTCVWHDAVSYVNIDEDYLAPEASKITINKTDKIAENGFIYISGSANFFGYITDINEESEYTVDVSFKPLIALFEHEVLLDVRKQNKDNISLESVIADHIRADWINSGDSHKNIPNLTVATTSTTTKWDFGLVADEEYDEYEADELPVIGEPKRVYKITKTGASNYGKRYIWNERTFEFSTVSEDNHEIPQFARVDFHGKVLTEALNKYGIVITPSVNMSRRGISLSIGTIDRSNPLYVEADLKNVRIKTFTIDEASKATNKLIVVNSFNYEEKITYYLHKSTHKHDTTNSDRIEPVVEEISVISPDIIFDESQHASDSAANRKTAYLKAVSDAWDLGHKQEADDVFGDTEWNNLIELEFGSTDYLVNPYEIKIGQEVRVIHDGTVYSSILTGKTISTVSILLSFGTIRMDLTKKLKLGGRL